MIIIKYKDGAELKERLFRNRDINKAKEHYNRLKVLPYYSEVEVKQY